MYYHIYLYNGNKYNYHFVITQTLQNGQTLGQFFELLYIHMWLYKEKRVCKRSLMEKLTIMDIVMLIFLCCLVACTGTFMYQNRVVCLHSSLGPIIDHSSITSAWFLDWTLVFEGQLWGLLKNTCKSSNLQVLWLQEQTNTKTGELPYNSLATQTAGCTYSCVEEVCSTQDYTDIGNYFIVILRHKLMVTHYSHCIIQKLVISTNKLHSHIFSLRIYPPGYKLSLLIYFVSIKHVWLHMTLLEWKMKKKQT